MQPIKFGVSPWDQWAEYLNLEVATMRIAGTIWPSKYISIPEFSSGNVTFFQQPKLTPVRTSDPTVQ